MAVMPCVNETTIDSLRFVAADEAAEMPTCERFVRVSRAERVERGEVNEMPTSSESEQAGREGGRRGAG